MNFDMEIPDSVLEVLSCDERGNNCDVALFIDSVEGYSFFDARHPTEALDLTKRRAYGPLPVLQPERYREFCQENAAVIRKIAVAMPNTRPYSTTHEHELLQACVDMRATYVDEATYVTIEDLRMVGHSIDGTIIPHTDLLAYDPHNVQSFADAWARATDERLLEIANTWARQAEHASAEVRYVPRRFYARTREFREICLRN